MLTGLSTVDGTADISCLVSYLLLRIHSKVLSCNGEMREEKWMELSSHDAKLVNKKSFRKDLRSCTFFILPCLMLS